MPVVVKAKKNDSTNDLIKRFKRLTIVANVLDIAKEREFYFKPSAKKNIQMNEIKRQKRRLKRIMSRGKKK